MRRAYFESGYGQLHVHHAMPPGGGFDEATALLCIHALPGTARVFDRFMHLMAQDRSIYAPDLPGHGQSDGAQTALSIADFAATFAEFLDTMRLRRVDLLGVQIGAVVAAELALLKPEHVRRIAMLAAPAPAPAPADTAPCDPRGKSGPSRTPVLVLRPGDAQGVTILETAPQSIVDELRTFLVP